MKAVLPGLLAGMMMAGCGALNLQPKVVAEYDRFRDFTKFAAVNIVSTAPYEDYAWHRFMYVCDGQQDCTADTLIWEIVPNKDVPWERISRLYLLIDGERASVELADLSGEYYWEPGTRLAFLLPRELAARIASAEVVEGQLNWFVWKLNRERRDVLRQLLEGKDLRFNEQPSAAQTKRSR